MSDYEVTLINDNSGFAFVSTITPELTAHSVSLPTDPTRTTADTITGKTSTSDLRAPQTVRAPCVFTPFVIGSSPDYSTFRRWPMESPRRAPRHVPVQVPQHRLHEPHLPPQHRRAVRTISFQVRNRSEDAKLTELGRSGSVCLDVINQTWSPMFDMINIFEVFLPQLLRYPNPTDPLNGEAAALLIREPKNYEAKVRGTLYGRPFLAFNRRSLPILTRLFTRVRPKVRQQGRCRRGGPGVRRRR